jgi:dethiobiotin synthase
MLDAALLPSPLWALGTDTNVGKTHVAAFIAKSWAKDGPVVYRKPFQTGVLSSDDAEADAPCVAGPNIAAETGAVFGGPLSPLAAAELEGRAIDLDEMLAWCKRPVPKEARLILEPAGGVMVPLANGATFANWASKMGVPCIIVARGGLGTLNHALLTADALHARSWEIAAVVLNPGLDGSFAAAEENAKILARFIKEPIYIL